MDNSEERVHKDTLDDSSDNILGNTLDDSLDDSSNNILGNTLDDSSNNPSESTTVDPSTEPTYSELSIEEKFGVLSGKTPIKYLDTHQTAISVLLTSLKSAVLSFTMVMTMSISTMLNNLVNTEFGKSIVEKAVNKILMYERGMHRIREQFDISFNCPPFNIEALRPTIDAVTSIYDTKLKEYVATLEDKTD
jgi:hypothetical protein